MPDDGSAGGDRTAGTGDGPARGRLARSHHESPEAPLPTIALTAGPGNRPTFVVDEQADPVELSPVEASPGGRVLRMRPASGRPGRQGVVVEHDPEMTEDLKSPRVAGSRRLRVALAALVATTLLGAAVLGVTDRPDLGRWATPYSGSRSFASVPGEAPAPAWTVDVPGACPRVGAAVDGAFVTFVDAGDVNETLAVELRDGTTRWRQPSRPRELAFDIFGAGDDVVVATGSRTSVRDAADGELLADRFYRRAGFATPLRGALLIGDFFSGVDLELRDAETLEVVFGSRARAVGPGSDRLAVVRGGEVHIVDTDGATVASLDAPGVVEAAVVGDVALLAGRRQATAFDVRTGADLWEIDRGGAGAAVVALPAGFAFVGQERSHIVGMDGEELAVVDGGALVAVRTGDEPYALTLDEGPSARRRDASDRSPGPRAVRTQSLDGNGRLGATETDGLLALAADHVLTADRSAIIARRLPDLSAAWTIDAGGDVCAAVPVGDGVVVATEGRLTLWR